MHRPQIRLSEIQKETQPTQQGNHFWEDLISDITGTRGKVQGRPGGGPDCLPQDAGQRGRPPTPGCIGLHSEAEEKLLLCAYCYLV